MGGTVGAAHARVSRDGDRVACVPHMMRAKSPPPPGAPGQLRPLRANQQPTAKMADGHKQQRPQATKRKKKR